MLPQVASRLAGVRAVFSLQRIIGLVFIVAHFMGREAFENGQYLALVITVT
jgi:hypothetical protein